jgi:3-deoxy-D-manno-octulosonic acid kinase
VRGLATPGDYHRADRRGAQALVKSEARAWATAIFDEAGTLYDVGGAATLATGQGRGAVRTLTAPEGEGRWVVRHYRRGGLLGPFWDDRYPRLGTPRPFAELEASTRLRQAGIRTPEVMAAATYPSGAFYRGDLVTVFAEGPTLIDFLSGHESNRGAQEQALMSVATAVTELAAVGAHHVDLNARNVLIDPASECPPWILDLDRMRFGTEPGRAAQLMSDRLMRSLAKLGCDSALLDRAAQILSRRGGPT